MNTLINRLFNYVDAGQTDKPFEYDGISLTYEAAEEIVAYIKGVIEEREYLYKQGEILQDYNRLLRKENSSLQAKVDGLTKSYKEAWGVK